MTPSPYPSQRRAWVTLLTKTSYLSGCLVLLSSLRRCQTKYPLVVLVNPLSQDPTKPDGLPIEVREILCSQGVQLREVEWLEPDNGTYNGPDDRFADTWTKLRFAGLSEYERVVLLDSDMLVRRNMDGLMEMPLRNDEIAAAHACTCNPRKLSHYPPDWIPENCGHTYTIPALPRSSSLSTPRQPSSSDRPTFHSLNSGLVVINPSEDTFESILHTLNNDPSVSTMKFPDQDLLALHFKGKVKFLGYEYNALKTLRDCHSNLWRDEGVRNVHYIIDKPWTKLQEKENGKLTEVEKWWWEEFGVVERTWAGSVEQWNLVRGTLR